MRTLISLLVVAVAVISLNAQTLEHKKVELNLEVYKNMDIEPTPEVSMFQKIYKNAIYTPEEKPAESTDEHGLIVEKKLTLEEYKKYDEANIKSEIEAINRPQRIYKVAIEFASDKAKKIYETEMVKRTDESKKKDLEKLVLATFQRSGPVNINSIQEFISHPFN